MSDKKQRGGFWAAWGGTLVGLYWGGKGLVLSWPRIQRWFAEADRLNGPLGVALLALAVLLAAAAVFFVVGWAFRKGWKAADAD